MMRSTAPRWVPLLFRGAAIYGIVALLLSYAAPPPPVGQASHYGFIGTALAFQFVFLLIGGDPVKYRALMLCGVAEKLAFGVPCAILCALGRIDTLTFGAGMFDLVLGAGFLLAWRVTPRG